MNALVHGRAVSVVNRIAIGATLCAMPAISGAQLALGLHRLPDDWRALRAGTFTDHSVMLLASVICLVCWVALVFDGLAGLLELRRTATVATELRGSLRLLAAVIGASTLAMLAGAKSQDDDPDGDVSAASLASLVTGSGVAGRVLATRRRDAGALPPGTVVLSVEPDRAEVHRTELRRAELDRTETEPRVIVRVYGNPVVETTDGRRAAFRKSRSLELLVWLALNRERPLRSAARTAIWDADISDSSFATVVSEMRRGLADLVPEVQSQAWSPPSYGDTISLSGEVCTDADLIESLLRQFRASPASVAGALAGELGRIRDLPFAGSNYAWPDLDGTTTRLVLLAFSAIEELVEWATDSGNGRAMAPVVAAGLRMIPGSQEMLDLQRRVSRLPAPKRTVASLPS